jgi:hypothetical protein
MPSTVAPLDQPTLLTVALLQLSGERRVAAIRPDRLAVNYLPGRRYLPRKGRSLDPMRAD